MDLRSNRSAGTNGQLFASEQEADLRHFLRENGSKPILGLVLSVPAVHLPSIIDIETPDVAASPKVRLLLYGHDGEEPRCVYRSPEL